MFFKFFFSFVLFAGVVFASDDRSSDIMREEAGIDHNKIEQADTDTTPLILRQSTQSSSSNQPSLILTPSKNDKAYLKKELNNRWWYQKFEYHFWNLSACGCRIGGGMFETVSVLAFLGVNGLIPIVNVLPLSAGEKEVASVVLASCNVVLICGPKMVKYLFQMSSEREAFAKDIAETGAIKTTDVDTPNYGGA